MNCRICTKPLRSVFDLRSSRSDALVPVFRCPDCNAYFSDGGVINYDDIDLVGYYTPYAGAIKARYTRVFSKVRELHQGPGRFLDIGAGMGYSLEVAQLYGWVAHGLEPNRRLVKNAVQRGLALEQGYLDCNRKGQYELILVDNVLEHVSDPAGFLRNAMRMLSPSGLLLVVIPPMDWLRKALAMVPYVRDHVERPQLNIFRESDEHLNMLGRRAMAVLAGRVGLDLLPVRFHHSRVFDNPLFRALQLDDGYYFMTLRNEKA